MDYKNIDFIDYNISNDILKSIIDIKNITTEEKNNIIYILQNKKCSYDAIVNLRKYIKSSYYIQINNNKYDRTLLLLADNLIKGRGDGRISENDMLQLIKSSYDNNVITNCEKDTLFYIANNYNITNKAKLYFENYNF
jgi:OOP family OmpA-OmpF porin